MSALLHLAEQEALAGLMRARAAHEAMKHQRDIAHETAALAARHADNMNREAAVHDAAASNTEAAVTAAAAAHRTAALALAEALAADALARVEELRQP